MWVIAAASRLRLLALVFVAAGLIVGGLIVVPGSAKQKDSRSSGDVKGDPPGPAAFDTPEIRKALKEARDKADRREAKRKSPEAKQERKRSRTAHKDLTKKEALAVAEDAHPGVMNARPWKPLRLRGTDEVKRYNGQFSAEVETLDGKRALATSTAPLRARDEDGDLAPVDLALERVQGGLRPKNAIAPVLIDDDVRQGIRFEKGDFGFGLRTPAAGAAPELVDGKAFYANVANDTDFVVEGAAYGVRTHFQLRSAEAPERTTLNFELPVGAKLEQTGSGDRFARVAKGDDTIAFIEPPAAWDAEGETFPVTMEVEGSRLALVFPHRDRDLTYPLMVDPVYYDGTVITVQENFNVDGKGNRTYGYNDPFNGWYFTESHSGYFPHYKSTDSANRGLTVYAYQGGTYYDGMYGEWYWQVPRHAFIERADFAYVTHTNPYGTCVIEGIWSPSRNNWDYGQWRDVYNNTGSSPTLRSSEACRSLSGNYKAHHVGNSTIPDNGDAEGTPGNMMIVGMLKNGTHTLGSYPTIRMEGATMWTYDNDVPVLNPPSHSGLSAGWTRYASITTSVYAREPDPGLGVKYFNFFLPGGTVTRTHGCSGDRNYMCPESWSTSVSYNTDQFSEGVTTPGAIAYDAISKSGGSSGANWTVKVDRSIPWKNDLGGTLLGGGSNGLDKNRQYSLTVDADDAYSGIRSVEVKIDGARIADQGGYVDRGCGANPGCSPTAFAPSFTVDTSQYSYGSHRVEVIVTDAVGLSRTATGSFDVRDRNAPRLEVSGGLRQPFAIRRDLHIKASDDQTGIRRIDVWLDPDSTPSANEARQSKQGSCSGQQSCTSPLEDDWVLPSDVPEGEHTILVRAEDGSGIPTEERWKVHVVNVRAASREKLGLEHWLQYDDTYAGANSRVFVNAETGNTVWHDVPIVNPGRGLSTVVNLTYNAHDRGGLLGTSLGRIPLVDVSDQSNGAIARDLPGFSYAEAGAGFSIAVSGPTRLNEPLGGALFAQAAEEGVEPAPGVRIDPSCSGPAPTVPKINCGQEIVLTDADGTMHVFTKSGDRWVPPPGVDMHLRRYRAGGDSLNPVAEKWALTRPDGVTHFFDNNGYLRRTADRNTNALEYDYERYNAFSDGPCAATDPIGQLISSVPGSEKLCALRVRAVRDPAGRELRVDYVQRGGTGILDQLITGLDYAYPPGIPGVVGGRSGRIAKITDHAGREYTFEYDSGYLAKFTEAANQPDKRVTRFEYETADEGLKAVGQDRQLTAIVDLRDLNKDGTIADGEEYARTRLRHSGRESSPVPGSFRPPRRAEQLWKRSDGDKTYGYTAPTSDSPRRFEVSEQQLGAQRGTTKHELDGRGRATKVVTPEGRTTTLEWNDQQNKVKTLTTAAGTPDEARTTYEYDDAERTGVLTAQHEFPKWPSTEGQRTTRFAYQHSGGRYRSDPDGNSATASPDDGGRFVADLNAITPPKSGTGWTFQVDPQTGNVTHQKDARGYTASTGYDALGRVTSETSEVPGENAVTYGPAFHPTGEPEEMVDKRGRRWRFRYDAVGNLIKVIDPRGGTSEDRGAPYVTTLTYDSFDRLTEEHVPKLSENGSFITRTRVYDRDGNVTTSTEPGVADGTSATTNVEYDKMGRPVKVTAPGGAAGTTEVTDYVYDDAQRLIGQIAPKGSRADAATLRSTHADACSSSSPPQPLAFATRFCLDADGQLLAQVRTSTRTGDTAALITSFARDRRGNAVAVVDPRRNAGASIPAAIANASDPTKQRRQITLNKVDEETAETEVPTETRNGAAVGATQWRYEYDANGNRVKAFHPTGAATAAGGERTTEMHYDHRDELIAIEDPGGGWTCYKRRQDGRVLAHTTPRGVAHHEPDSPGTKCLNGDPSDHYTYFTTRYGYDAAGDLESRTLPFAPGQYGRSDADLKRWKVTVTKRDAVGNPETIVDARGNSTDAAGDGVITNTFYDTGDLRTTTRPSFFDLDWPGQGGDPRPDGGERFGVQDTEQLPIGTGGPQVVPRDWRSRNAERGEQEREVPESLGKTDFGEVDPEPLPHLIPQAGSTSFSYDGRMRLTKITGADGQERRLAYDDAGRVRSASWPFIRDSAATEANEEERIRHAFTYDAHGNVKTVTEPHGDETTFDYDGYDRLVEEVTPGAHNESVDGTPRAETTRFTYDANGNLRTRETPRGTETPTVDGDMTFTYRYDSLDRLIGEKNPAGSEWTYHYDAAGNRELQTSPRGQGAGTRIEEFQTRYKYDALDQVTDVTEKVRDGDTVKDIVTRFEYDADGNRDKIVEPGASKTLDGAAVERVVDLVFDGRGLPWKRTVGTGDETRTTLTEFDPNGNVRRTVNPAGIDASGNAKAVDDGSGSATNVAAATKNALLREYNDDDLLKTVRLPWDDADTRKFKQEFQRTDPLKNVTSILSPHEAEEETVPRTSYAYFDTGWARWVSDEKLVDKSSNKRVTSRLVEYEYDEHGNQTRWTSKNANETAAGREIRRSFWPNGLLKTRTAKKTTDPDEPATRRRYDYLYNRNRSLVRMIDENLGRTTVIARDNAERETKVNETWTTGKDTWFDYDAAGNVEVRRTDGSAQTDGTYGGADAKRTEFSYDSLDRETSMTVTQGTDARTTTTTYHPSGERRTRSKPNGTVDRWFYNSRGERIRHERDPQAGDTEVEEYGYDANGNRNSDERGTHVFNARDQLVKWTRPDDHKTKPGWTVTYELRGDGATEKRTERDKGGALKQQSTYELVGERLKRVVTEDRTGVLPTKIQSDYFHDDFGNVVRIERKVLSDNTVLPPTDRTGLEPTQCNELPSRTDTTTTHYCYDEFERLTFSKGQGIDDPAHIKYDGLDRRDERTVETATGENKRRDYSYVGLTEQLSREVDADGDRKTYDYDSTGERQGQSRRDRVTGETKFRPYALDANGSVVGLEEADGRIPDDAGSSQRYTYDPYGELEPKTLNADDAETGLSQAAKDNPFRFEGFYYDSGVKTYDMYARHYRPDVGRFLSQDRFAQASDDQVLQADPLTQNRYAFAGGNPVNNVEFDGHFFHKKLANFVKKVARTVARAFGGVAGRSSSRVAVQRRQALARARQAFVRGQESIAAANLATYYELRQASLNARAEQIQREVAALEEMQPKKPGAWDVFKATVFDPGDWTDWVATGVSWVPWAGQAVKGGKTVHKLNRLRKLMRTAAGAAKVLGAAQARLATAMRRAGENFRLTNRLKDCAANSFTRGTPVRMADGSSRRIEDVRVGDRVLATDPLTGRTSSRRVTALIRGTGGKQLTEVWIDGRRTTATDEHQFFVLDRGWVDAADLRRGDLLVDERGRIVEVQAALDADRFDTVYNLTVEGVHTYHAGAPAVLVHNASCDLFPRPSGFRAGVREKVWNNWVEAATGRVRDPLSGRFMSKNDPWDMGHLPGLEFRKHQRSAQRRGLSREQFLDEYNDPSHYRPELPGSNRSHRGESDTEDLWNP